MAVYINQSGYMYRLKKILWLAITLIYEDKESIFSVKVKGNFHFDRGRSQYSIFI